MMVRRCSIDDHGARGADHPLAYSTNINIIADS